MTWNHRIVRRRFRRDVGNGATWYEIREVYYDRKGRPDAYTKDAVAAGGTTVNELREELVRMLAATFKPVLNYRKERSK